MSLVRVQATTKVTLTQTFTVDEILTNASGPVAVTVKRLDGTAVTSGTATNTSTGTYTFDVTATADLDTWTVDWAGTVNGAAVVVRDIVEIVGGFMFGLGEARRLPGLADTTKYPAALLADKRIAVEQEADLVSGHAWVPRFERVRVNGVAGPSLALPRMPIRRVRAVTVRGVAWSAGQLAAITPTDSGVLELSPGGVWDAIAQPGSVIVEYEHGPDLTPPYVRDAALVRLRSMIGQPNSGVPYNALSWTAQDGGTYRLVLPGRKSTGDPAVDAAYLRESYDGPV